MGYNNCYVPSTTIFSNVYIREVIKEEIIAASDTLKGDSAYEVAVKLGYKGNEEEWLTEQGATIEQINVNTGAAGTNASVVLNGTPKNRRIDLTIPRGDRGIQGERGEAGPSNYEVALSSGFVGTKAEWLSSIKGEKGDRGIDGIQGEEGKSTYDLSVDYGFVGSEREWLSGIVNDTELMSNLNEDLLSIDKAANGDINTTVVTRTGETYPSAKKAISEGITSLFENGGLPATPFATKALMTASALVDGDYAMVTDETANNGLYVKTAGSWVKSTYDPVTQAGVVATAKSEAAKSEAIAEAKLYVDDVNKSNIKGVVGKNLFDKSKVETGKALADVGTTFNTSGRNVSSYIPVKPDTVYSFSNTVKAAFYDTNKVFVQLVPASAANVTSASTAAFVRLDVSDANLDTAQMELGEYKTVYEPYKIVLPAHTVSTSVLKDNSITTDKLQPMSVQAKHLADAVFLNMHDASTLRKGITVNLTNGKTETPSEAYDTTAYIPCKPNTAYIANEMSRVLFYRADGSFISASPDTTFITPSDCTQMRFTLSSIVSFRFQLNEGTVLPDVVPQPHKFYLPEMHVTPQSKIELSNTLGRKINFSDAWYAWRNNEKFPIAFLGDSTTNGNGTTGYSYRDSSASLGQDYATAPNAYTQLFENYIRDITGNNVMRAYNAGFSGRNAAWALANIDAIFGEAYSDVKMIGISMGINDRTASAALYARNFYRDIEGIIQWCFNKGIQPFLLTSQPCTIPGWVGEGTGADIQEVANEIKKNLAAKYDLELVDVSKFGEQFMQYSTEPLLNNIMEAGSNVIHFGDGGHKFTAELLFANFCKRCIWTTQGEQLDYATQLTFSEIEHTQIKQIVPFKQGFKIELNTTQTTAENKLLQEYWVFNAGRKQLDLTAYFANAAVGQYVEVDDVQSTITTQGQELGTLDLGLHKIKAYSSATTALDWLGFKLTPTTAI